MKQTSFRLSAQESAPRTLSRAIRSALVQQVIAIVLGSNILDGGAVLQICIYGIAGFWGGVGVLLWRRGLSAVTPTDLELVEKGSILACILSIFVTSWIWSLRGY